MEAIFGAFIAGVLGIVVAWITSLLARRTEKELARTAQLELRRTKRHEFLIGLMNDLMQARTEYEEWLGRNPEEPLYTVPLGGTEIPKHARIVGQAITACLASGDKQLIEYTTGDEGMTPYVNVPNGRNRNRNSMWFATVRLAELLGELTEHEDAKPSLVSRLASLFNRV